VRIQCLDAAISGISLLIPLPDLLGGNRYRNRHLSMLLCNSHRRHTEMQRWLYTYRLPSLSTITQSRRAKSSTSTSGPWWRPRSLAMSGSGVPLTSGRGWISDWAPTSDSTSTSVGGAGGRSTAGSNTSGTRPRVPFFALFAFQSGGLVRASFVGFRARQSALPSVSQPRRASLQRSSSQHRARRVW
jgi:hypothetical protein